MRHPMDTAIETLMMMLMPGATLAYFALLLRDTLPTLHVFVDSLAANPPRARMCLAAALAVLLGAPGAALVTATRRRGGEDADVALPDTRGEDRQ